MAALVACILHAIVLPLVSASMRANQLVAADLARAAAVICHTTDVAVPDGIALAASGQVPPSTSAPPAPGNDGDDCPICKGLAALQFALLVSVVLGVAERHERAAFARPEAVQSDGLTLATPRNRGPPIQV